MAFAAILTLVATPAMLALPYQSREMFDWVDERLMIRDRLSKVLAKVKPAALLHR